MSQFFIDSANSPSPPTVATSFVTQDGTAVPSANILNVNAYDSDEDNINGITSKGGVADGDPPGTGAANDVGIYLTNRYDQTGATSGDTSTLITILSSLAEGAYVFDMSIAAYATAGGPAANGYTLVGGVRSDGATATLLPGQAIDAFEDVVPGLVELSVSGNNVQVNLTGAAGFDFNWRVTGTYMRHS